MTRLDQILKSGNEELIETLVRFMATTIMMGRLIILEQADEEAHELYEKALDQVMPAFQEIKMN